MYWPTSVVRSLALPAPLDHEPIIKLRQNRRGNFFITLTKSGLGVWDIRPTVLQSALVRTAKSLERWGSNVDVCWAHDGRGIIVLTSNSHLLVYQLQPTSKPSFDHPPTPQFPSGVQAGAGEGDTLMGWTLKNLGVAFIMGGCESMSSQSHSFSFTLRHPPSILTVPFPIPLHLLAPPGSHYPPPPMDGDGEDQVECNLLDLNELGFLGYQQEPPIPKEYAIHRVAGIPVLQTVTLDDGKVWSMHPVKSRRDSSLRSRRGGTQPSEEVSTDPSENLAGPSTRFVGHQLHPVKRRLPSRDIGLDRLSLQDSIVNVDKATRTAINARFGQMAVGTESGNIDVVTLPTSTESPHLTHRLDLKHSANLRVSPGAVTSLCWTSDGYALAVGYEHAWAVWTVGGRLNGWGMALAEGDGRPTGGEGFLHGVIDLFWAPGNLELFVLANPTEQLYAIPFAKSATTSLHSPDNCRYAFLQLDDRVMVYKGADQPDMNVINPESDVWQQIKICPPYMSSNWPVRCAAISMDGKLIAIAGRRGLSHYSMASGKWKLFNDESQEQEITVRGGMVWFHHVLVVAVEIDKTNQIRLYSRDQDLDESHILHSFTLPMPILVMTLHDNSLLVYTTDNTLYHFLIVPTTDTIKLQLCGSISFAGIVAVPSRVRAMSWLVPEAQKRLGNPADDLLLATIIFLYSGKLMLLRPRRAGSNEVRYDMQVLADNIESYWTHLSGVGTLEGSLWGYDGDKMRVWLDALTIEHTREEEGGGEGYERVGESLSLDLDFYPLSILMDKGIIIGIDYEQSSRSLPFSLYKIQTSTHLFLPLFMRYHLANTSLQHALLFARNYASIVYFAHALEVLLHSILEDVPISTPDEPIGRIHRGVAEILEIAVEFLDYFPESLDVAIGCARKTEMERWDVLFAAVGQPRELYETCIQEGKWRTAASCLLILHNLEELKDVQDTVRLIRLAMEHHEYRLCKELLRFLWSIDDTGRTVKDAIDQLDLLGRGTVTPGPGLTSGAKNASRDRDTVAESLPANGKAEIVDLSSPHLVESSETVELNKPQRPTAIERVSSSMSSVAMVPSSSASSLGTPGRDPRVDRVTSPFQLESPRTVVSPPSPRTIEPGWAGKVPDPPAVPTPP